MFFVKMKLKDYFKEQYWKLIIPGGYATHLQGSLLPTQKSEM